jgi:hypothetical protein
MSPATRPSASSRSRCGSTPPITSSGCGSTSTWRRCSALPASCGLPAAKAGELGGDHGGGGADARGWNRADVGVWRGDQPGRRSNQTARARPRAPEPTRCLGVRATGLLRPEARLRRRRPHCRRVLPGGHRDRPVCAIGARYIARADDRPQPSARTRSRYSPMPPVKTSGVDAGSEGEGSDPLRRGSDSPTRADPAAGLPEAREASRSTAGSVATDAPCCSLVEEELAPGLTALRFHVTVH